jgi:hypothetical protein
MEATSQTNLKAIRDIRKIMERSSRFISLSGWSGIMAGICGIAGAWVANERIDLYYEGIGPAANCADCLKNELIGIAAVVFVVAFICAVVFTYIKSKKEGVPIWGKSARRLLWNTMLPMIVGGFVILKMMDLNFYELLAPLALVFYGLALINGSKYTMGEVRYLGYAEIITGIFAMYFVRYGLYAWAFGFGLLHIIYGISMWWNERRKVEVSQT